MARKVKTCRDTPRTDRTWRPRSEQHYLSSWASGVCHFFRQVYPQAWNQIRLQAPAEDEEDEAGVVCLPAKAGTAVVFLSKWVTLKVMK